MTHAAASSMPMEPMGDTEAEAHLMELLADMSDDEINELADIADAIHAEGGADS